MFLKITFDLHSHSLTEEFYFLNPYSNTEMHNSIEKCYSNCGNPTLL